MTTLKITQSGWDVKIELDDLDISSSVQSLELELSANSRPQVRAMIGVLVSSVEVDILAEEDSQILVSIPNDVVETLQLLGWIKSDQKTYRVPRVQDYEEG